MQRYRLTLEFDGSAFVGWQYQTNGLTVQEVVETAIGRFCATVPRIMSAGRTDSGVHALGMVAHADIDRDMSVDRLFEALNFHMRPHPVVVREIVPVPPEFDARRPVRRRRCRRQPRIAAASSFPGVCWNPLGNRRRQRVNHGPWSPPLAAAPPGFENPGYPDNWPGNPLFIPPGFYWKMGQHIV